MRILGPPLPPKPTWWNSARLYARRQGWVGPSKTLWGFAVDPECDQPELLAALAMLHRNWWRS